MINPNQDRWTAFEQMIEDARATEEKVASNILDAIMDLPIELHELIEVQALDIKPQAIKRMWN